MEEEYKINKQTMWQVLSGILLVLLIVSVYTNGFTGAMVKEVEEVKAVKSEAKVAPPVAKVADPVVEVSIDDDSIEGDLNAPVTIVEFSDYECPYCARFWKDAYSEIVTEYVDTGKVKLVFRDFPLSFHKEAQKAAEAAECAGEQDKYYEMHDKLFGEGVVGGVTTFKAYATELNLNMDKFNTCLDNGEMAEEVKKDFADGQKYGVTGTPAFFINGEKIVGAQPFEAFKQIIDSKLEG